MTKPQTGVGVRQVRILGGRGAQGAGAFSTATPAPVQVVEPPEPPPGPDDPQEGLLGHPVRGIANYHGLRHETERVTARDFDFDFVVAGIAAHVLVAETPRLTDRDSAANLVTTPRGLTAYTLAPDHPRVSNREHDVGERVRGISMNTNQSESTSQLVLLGTPPESGNIVWEVSLRNKNNYAQTSSQVRTDQGWYAQGYMAFGRNPNVIALTRRDSNSWEGASTNDNGIKTYTVPGGTNNLTITNTSSRPVPSRICGMAIRGTTIFIINRDPDNRGRLNVNLYRIHDGSKFTQGPNSLQLNWQGADSFNMSGLFATGSRYYSIDQEHGLVRAWNRNSGARDAAADINLHDDNSQPFDLTVDGTIMLISDGDNNIYAYDIS